MQRSHRPHAEKEYRAGRMVAVYWRQERRCVIKRHLSADGGGKIAQQIKFVVVAEGIGLHAGQELLFKSTRLGIFAQQQFVGAIYVFNARPEIVRREPQRSFSQITVEVFARLQRMIAPPQQRGGKVLAFTWPDVV